LATWTEMSDDCFRAAEQLFKADHYRSSVSRSYYAAYCSLTAALTSAHVTFARGWGNPGHEQLPRLIRNHLPVADWRRRWINSALRSLRLHRESADYRPAGPVDRAVARQCLRGASIIRQQFGRS